MYYLPPPAQAQAQPAQAQAQAQEEPPLLPLYELDETGGGLVLLVTPPVNDFKPPITPAEKFSTPFTTDAAKSEPGKRGRVAPGPVDDDVFIGLIVELLVYPGS